MLKTSIFLAFLRRTKVKFHLKKNNLIKLVGPQRFTVNSFLHYNNRYFPFAIFSLVSFWSNNREPEKMSLTETELNGKARQEAIDKADEAFTANKHEEVCEILSNYKDSGDVEVLWRIARSKYKISSQIHSSDHVKTEAIKDGFSIISKALEINDKHYAVHKWMSVLLDAKSKLVGTKERIEQLENVKKHMLEAVKLNPSDATTYHMLGCWCYQIADMSWYQVKIAKALFASPPTSTYQEALEYFKQAEEAQPNFYSQNLLMLGKTYLKLGEQERAHYYLKLTTHYLVSSDDDLMAYKEAETLLKKMNYKSS